MAARPAKRAEEKGSHFAQHDNGQIVCGLALFGFPFIAAFGLENAFVGVAGAC